MYVRIQLKRFLDKDSKKPYYKVYVNGVMFGTIELNSRTGTIYWSRGDGSNGVDSFPRRDNERRMKALFRVARERVYAILFRITPVTDPYFED